MPLANSPFRVASLTAASRLTSRRANPEGRRDRDGSGAASDRERDRERGRDREARGGPVDLTDRVAELEFALARVQQRMSNYGADFHEFQKFKVNSTDELKLQKERMDQAEADVKAKMKEMNSAIVILQNANAENIYVGTPVDSPVRPRADERANAGRRPDTNPPGFPTGSSNAETQNPPPRFGTDPFASPYPNRDGGASPSFPADARASQAPRTNGNSNNEDFKIDRKVPKTLVPFDGSSVNYRNWHSRITDHLIGCNPAWSNLLTTIEAEQQPILFSRLRSGIPGIHTDPQYIYVFNCGPASVKT